VSNIGLAENSLLERLRRYERFFNNAQDLFFILDTNGRFLDMNPRFADLLGYKVDELIGKTSKMFCYPEDLPKLRQFFRAVLEGETKRGEFRFVTKNGDIKWGELVEWPVCRGERIVEVEGIARDITERKKLEDELRYSRERFKFFSENTEDGILVHEKGIIVDVNKRLAEMFGYDVGEIMGKPVLDLAAPESKETVLRNIKSGYEGKYEAIGIRKDGSKFYTEVIVKNSIYMGKPVRVAVIRDITERKEMEEKLRKSEEKYRFLVENSSDIIYTTDYRGYFTYVNEAAVKLLKYSKDEIVGKHYLEFIHPEWKEKVFNFYYNQFKNRIPITYYEFPVIDRDGNVIWVGQNVQTIMEGDRVKGFQAIVRDITERKKLEIQLRNLNEQLRVLNKILRHDVMNDLTVVSGCLQLIQPHDDYEKEMIETALNRIEKTAEFIKKMRELEIAISEGGELKEVDVRSVVDHVVSTYPELKSEVRGEGKVMADDALYSVIENIIRNAAIHSGSERVDIDIRKVGNWVEIKISDYGKGIPEKIREKVFEEGFKHGKTGGTGIGLYIVKKLVERYGGTVEIESANPNGTTFVIKLRAAK
jgi:PAS domain S-box-containing protein